MIKNIITVVLLAVTGLTQAQVAVDLSSYGVKVQTGGKAGSNVAVNTAGEIDSSVEMEGVAVINGEVMVDGVKVPRGTKTFKSKKSGKTYEISWKETVMWPFVKNKLSLALLASGWLMHAHAGILLDQPALLHDQGAPAKMSSIVLLPAEGVDMEVPATYGLRSVIGLELGKKARVTMVTVPRVHQTVYAVPYAQPVVQIPVRQFEARSLANRAHAYRVGAFGK